MSSLAKLFMIVLAMPFAAAMALHGSTEGRGLASEKLLAVSFEQKLGSKITGNAAFIDEQGKAVTLARYLHRGPIILLLGYYQCPMLCNLSLNGLVEGLLDLNEKTGPDFEVVMVSIDPRETPPLAAAKRQTYLRRYARAGADIHWHFLTGNASAIAALSDEVGFHYAYDASVHQYAHPSGFVVLTPEGAVSKYFFGVKYSAAEIDAALAQAQAGTTGSPIQQFLLLCFHYSPLTGKYGKWVMIAVRGSGLLTMAMLACLLMPSLRRRFRKRREAPV